MKSKFINCFIINFKIECKCLWNVYTASACPISKEFKLLLPSQGTYSRIKWCFIIIRVKCLKEIKIKAIANRHWALSVGQALFKYFTWVNSSNFHQSPVNCGIILISSVTDEETVNSIYT